MVNSMFLGSNEKETKTEYESMLIPVLVEEIAKKWTCVWKGRPKTAIYNKHS